MQELEKILEEIKDELKDIYLDIANNYNISDLQYDGDKVACVASKFRCTADDKVEKIIHKHIFSKDTDITNKCGNCSRRKWYQKGYDDGKKNDGWIPVEERLPEAFGKYWVTIRYDDGRISEPVVVNFQGVKQKYVVDTPNGREYETWGIDSAFHGSRVIAWRPYYIPEPYRPERSEKHDGK